MLKLLKIAEISKKDLKNPLLSVDSLHSILPNFPLSVLQLSSFLLNGQNGSVRFLLIRFLRPLPRPFSVSLNHSPLFAQLAESIWQ